MKMHLATLLALGLGLSAACSFPQPPPKKPPVNLGPEGITQGEAEYLEVLEEEIHVARGPELRRLLRSPALDAAALLHALDMAENDYFDHESLDGREPIDRVAQAAPLVIVADVKENLFFLETNAPPLPSVRATSAHRGLMDSPGHRENILNDRSTHIGLAVVRHTGPELVKEYTVQLFGRELGRWTQGAPPTRWQASSGPRSFPFVVNAPNIEFYVSDLDNPRREYPAGGNRYFVGGFMPRLGPNDQTMQFPALQPGRYTLGARLHGEDGYAPTNFTIVVE